MEDCRQAKGELECSLYNAERRKKPATGTVKVPSPLYTLIAMATASTKQNRCHLNVLFSSPLLSFLHSHLLSPFHHLLILSPRSPPLLFSSLPLLDTSLSYPPLSPISLTPLLPHLSTPSILYSSLSSTRLLSFTPSSLLSILFSLPLLLYLLCLSPPPPPRLMPRPPECARCVPPAVRKSCATPTRRVVRRRSVALATVPGPPAPDGGPTARQTPIAKET